MRAENGTRRNKLPPVKQRKHERRGVRTKQRVLLLTHLINKLPQPQKLFIKSSGDVIVGSKQKKRDRR